MKLYVKLIRDTRKAVCTTSSYKRIFKNVKVTDFDYVHSFSSFYKDFFIEGGEILTVC